jgi:phosphoenolpyruvate carboxylase
MAKKKKRQQRTFSVLDIDGCAKMIRDSAIESIAGMQADLATGDTGETPDDYLRVEQVKNLINGTKIGDDDDGQPLITQKILDEICDISTNMVFGVGLSKLASSGYLEVSFNDKTNEFEFSRSLDNSQE